MTISRISFLNTLAFALFFTSTVNAYYIEVKPLPSGGYTMTKRMTEGEKILCKICIGIMVVCVIGGIIQLEHDTRRY